MRSTKGRSWEIQSMRDWTDCNISSSKLQQAAIQEKKEKSSEPCRFVSEGEKPVVRSNRPLIFLSCIKGTILLGGYAGEHARLIFTVYLMLSANVYIHLHGICPKIHNAGFCSPLRMNTKPLFFGCIVSVKRITSDFFDKVSLAVINPKRQQPGLQQYSTKTTSEFNSFLFCLCVRSLASLMFHADKRPLESIHWWREMATELM